MENRLCTAAFLAEPPPTRVAHSRRAVAMQTIADEVDVNVVAVGWPVALEVVEKGRPLWRNPVCLEIPNRKRKGVIDADERRGGSRAAPTPAIRRCPGASSVCAGSAAVAPRQAKNPMSPNRPPVP
jgi:hypothetical protein